MTAALSEYKIKGTKKCNCKCAHTLCTIYDVSLEQKNPTTLLGQNPARHKVPSLFDRDEEL